jgi:ADP-ribosylation factor-binding protein GGA
MFNANNFASGPSGWMNTSQLEMLITAACDPSQYRPDPAKQLEVAEYINQKKANT